MPIERLQAFYRRWYQPDNAVLVVAGNDALRTVKTAMAGSFDRTAFVVSGPDAAPAAARGGRRQR